MSGLLDFMSGRFAADLVSALLHTLWQALVIAGLLYVFLKHTAARNTNLRYGAGVASLVLVVICGLVTWAVLDFDPAAAPAKTSGSQRASAYGGFDWWRLTDAFDFIQAYDHKNSGEMHRDWTFVQDIVAGLVSALDRPLGYECINLGRGEPVLLADFVHLVEELAGRKAHLVPTPMMDADILYTYADINEARRLLDYHPHVSVTEGVTRFWQWYREAVLG